MGENRSVLGYGEEKLLSFEIEERYKDILISHQGEGKEAAPPEPLGRIYGLYEKRKKHGDGESVRCSSLF